MIFLNNYIKIIIHAVDAIYLFSYGYGVWYVSKELP